MLPSQTEELIKGELIIRALLLVSWLSLHSNNKVPLFLHLESLALASLLLPSLTFFPWVRPMVLVLVRPQVCPPVTQRVQCTHHALVRGYHCFVLPANLQRLWHAHPHLVLPTLLSCFTKLLFKYIDTYTFFFKKRARSWQQKHLGPPSTYWCIFIQGTLAYIEQSHNISTTIHLPIQKYVSGD